MKRLHKNMLTAALLLVGGAVVGIYTLKTKVKTPEQRFRESQNSKRLYPKLGRDHVKGGTFYAKSATVSFERDATVGWKITAPIEWPADTKAIDAALDRMAALVIDPIITEDATTEDLSRAGLDKPEVSLRVKLKDGGEHTLHVGPRNKIADRFPVTDSKKKRIGLSEPTFQWAVDRALDELRNKGVLYPWTEDDVTAITVFEPDGRVRFELAKTEERWTTSGPGVDPILADAGSRLLLAVAVTKRLKADAFLTDAYDPADAAATKKFGLHAPLFTLQVTAGDVTRRLIVAKHTERKDEALVAHLEGTGTVVELRPSLAKKVDKTPIDLRDRTILRFEKKDVRNIRFRYASGVDLSVARENKDDWTVVSTKKPAKSWKMDSILRGFSYLKGIELHAHSASKKDLEEWLLDPYSRHVSFEGEGGKVLGAIRIGKYAEDGKIFIMADGIERVMLIEDTKIDLLPKGIDDVTDEER